jgi:hypothetical protein
LEAATSEPDLRGLCVLLGPAGIRCVERRMLVKLEEIIKRVIQFVISATPACKALAEEDRGLFQVRMPEELCKRARLHSKETS